MANQDERKSMTLWVPPPKFPSRARRHLSLIEWRYSLEQQRKDADPPVMDQRDSGEVASSTVSCSNSLLLHYICTTIKSLHATIRNFHPQYSVSKISSTGNLHLRIMSQGSSPLFSSQALFRTFPYGFPGDADATPSLRHPYLTVLNCLPDSSCLETTFPELWGIRD
ncbi:hypothetical protein CPSG_01935 [Coccidioides posadasii str. Silveira]|uniref:Uncharacterized protein n=1 Tax=Coccidioides posadasii (strain RMSCC 757 / Silveira) TaxID=443226 RepID=E9CWV2_COCPS|nr:hypothetical protein CPSG_01935 [Coccidioides posadasii str. Silveira]